MKIYIMPDSKHRRRAKYLRELASIAQPQIHTISENPEEADIIIITHQHLTDLTDPYLNRFLGQHLHKCYTINDSDQPLFGIAGLYASGNKSFCFLHKHCIRGSSYVYELCRSDFNVRNKFVNFSQDFDIEKKYLFSFVGASNAWVRKRLLKLKLQRNDILIRSTNHYNHWNVNQENAEEIQKTYVDIIQSSKFVLCPRGVGWGSLRLFEVMELGVAPVIISDKWLAPMGPDWDSFALFVKQSNINNLVEILESHASEYQERGSLARKAWEEYFSDPVIFNRCIEAIEDLQENRIAILDRLIFQSYPLMLVINRLNVNFRRLSKFIILKLFNLLKLQFPYELINK
jgi:hypothetical protein